MVVSPAWCGAMDFINRFNRAIFGFQEAATPVLRAIYPSLAEAKAIGFFSMVGGEKMNKKLNP